MCGTMQSECIVSAYIRSRIVLYLLPSAVALLLCFVPLCVLFQLIIASPAPAPLSRHQSQWVFSSRGHLDFLAPFKFYLFFSTSHLTSHFVLSWMVPLSSRPIFRERGLEFQGAFPALSTALHSPHPPSSSSALLL